MTAVNEAKVKVNGEWVSLVPDATTSSKGIVQVGDGLSVTDGVISVSGGLSKLYIECTTTATSITMGTVSYSFDTQTIEYDTPFSVSPTPTFTKSTTAPNFLESNGEFEGITAEGLTCTVSASAYLYTSQSATFTLVDSNGSTLGSATVRNGNIGWEWVSGSIGFTYSSALTYTLSTTASGSNRGTPSVSINSNSTTVYA